MTRTAQCGKLPPARNRRTFCPVCTALEQVDQTADDAEEQIETVFDKCDRIHKIRKAYRRRR